MEEENPLCSLANYINVNGEEALSRRVGEERTELERTGPENEVERDVLFFRRRRRLYLDEGYARLFARYYGNAMSDEENSLRYRRQKRVLGRMLVKELIPFIYRHMNDLPFEEHWSITGDQFEALNDGLSVKFHKIHSGRQRQAIIQCFTRAMCRLEERVNVWPSIDDTY